MPKPDTILKSFSFRAGLLIFLGLCVTLLTLRVLMYYQSVDATYDDVRNLINAHAFEMDQAMEANGVYQLKDNIDALITQAQDKNLYLGLRGTRYVSGNFTAWDEIEPPTEDGGKFRELYIPRDGAAPLHLLIKTLHFSKKITLVIGYDIHQIDSLHHSLHIILFKNIMLSLFISLVLSFLIMWLLNRHLRKFNKACEAVMAGDLQYRIKTVGGYDQFEHLAQNLNEMLDWNSTLLSTVADSSNAIAHDMRTPISRIRMKLSTISERPDLDKDTRKQLQQNINLIDKVVVMFDNILNIAKAESRAGTEFFEDIDIRQLVQDVTEFHESIFEDKQIKLTCTLPDTPVYLRGDKQLLGQAFVNLIDNAAKYTAEGGQVSVLLEQQDSLIKLTVADNGGGMPDELLEKAKDRFFRVDRSRHTHGFGLGLSLVNAVATLHNGRLTLRNTENGLQAMIAFEQATMLKAA